MFINATGYFLPETRLDNSHYAALNGRDEQWIEQRTGIKTRAVADPEENINSMCLKAIEAALPQLPYDIKDVDLIISASYTPHDTVFTAAHEAQHRYGIENAKAFQITAACSSFVNALEIADAYFKSGKAGKALILASDHNTAFCDAADPVAGHLWGDTAVAFFVSDERVKEGEPEIADVITMAMGYLPKAPTGVNLHPHAEGITMAEGRDVFQKACTYIPETVTEILSRNGLTIDNLTYLIPHQANMRIIRTVARQLALPEEKCLCNIVELGNTGSASSALMYAQNRDSFKTGDVAVLSVFGGGYSAAACLIKH